MCNSDSAPSDQIDFVGILERYSNHAAGLVRELNLIISQVSATRSMPAGFDFVSRTSWVNALLGGGWGRLFPWLVMLNVPVLIFTSHSL